MMTTDLSQLVFRPVKLLDLDDICDLAGMAQAGMTTLPTSRRALEKKIMASEQSFLKRSFYTKGNYYLFVLEDLSCRKVVGLAAMISSVGVQKTFLSFEQKQLQSFSSQLGVKTHNDFLHLHHTRDGDTELLTLFLHPDYRQRGIGRFLSLSRFLFIRQHPLRFKKRVFAEIRGHIDDVGVSPFYDAFVKPYLKIPFKQADVLSQLDNQFISDLLPHFPLSLQHVSQSVLDCIQKPHRLSQRALQLLYKEGFKLSKHIDVLDAGPKIVAQVKDIRVYAMIRSQNHFNVVDHLKEHSLHLVSAGTLANFRVCCTEVDDTETLKVLQTPALDQCLDKGYQLQWARLYAKSRRRQRYTHLVSKRMKGVDSPFMKHFSTWYQRAPQHIYSDD
ncbi:hypothetical protein DID76_04165 [Candidatus Marinamargulisbacteria bacterium SCGC AG-414-C22]|nr:hypothetical protein DID76_04165 [Candidatus Marinamargulisbacteria bacterium SCGC AG-414-C22]